MSAQIIQLPQARPKVSDDKPALADGYCKIVNDVVDALAQAPLTSRQFRVVWAIVRKTYGFNKAKDRISGSQLAKETGLVRQRCSQVLGELLRMGVIVREGTASGFIKLNTKVDEWQIDANQHSHIPERKGSPKPSSEPGRGAPDQNGFSEPKMSSHLEPKMSSHKRQNTTYRKTTSYSSSPSENPESDQEAKSEKPKACPYQKIIDLYHEILPQLAEVQVLSDKRKSQLKARWQQRVGRNGQRRCDNLEFWEKYFNYVSTCPFLIGQGRSTGDRPVFFADLEWLTNASNFAKVIEGKYAPERGES
ncbi:MAG: replication protein [Marinobacter sp.]